MENTLRHCPFQNWLTLLYLISKAFFFYIKVTTGFCAAYSIGNGNTRSSFRNMEGLNLIDLRNFAVLLYHCCSHCTCYSSHNCFSKNNFWTSLVAFITYNHKIIYKSPSSKPPVNLYLKSVFHYRFLSTLYTLFIMKHCHNHYDDLKLLTVATTFCARKPSVAQAKLTDAAIVYRSIFVNRIDDQNSWLLVSLYR
jgi:hypothetical protein